MTDSLLDLPCTSHHARTSHHTVPPEEDSDLLAVHAWLKTHDLTRVFTAAVVDAIEYVLDGSRTWRFDLDSPDVDADERRTVGTKLQYRLIAGLGLTKSPPLDTHIIGIPVELKATLSTSWMIPREGQCQISLLSQLDTKKDRHRAILMRTHRAWLNAPNQDGKRSIKAAARGAHSLPLVDWIPLPRNPLKQLSPKQLEVVFSPQLGQEARLSALFGHLPGVVIPRVSILTVCANRQDPLRRARHVKERVLREHGLRLLCGKWEADRRTAEKHGFTLTDAAWLAV